MPSYTPEEQRNIDVTHRLFDTTSKEEKSLLFTEDAVWWNGLPFVGAGGQTEHKGRDAIRGILTGATSGPSARKTDSGVDAYDVSTIRNEDIVLLADGDYVVKVKVGQGEPTTVVRLIEHGSVIARAYRSAASERVVEFPITDAAPGEHHYTVELENSAGTTDESGLVVRVAG